MAKFKRTYLGTTELENAYKISVGISGGHTPLGIRWLDVEGLDYIQMILREKVMRIRIGVNWLRTEAGGGNMVKKL